MAEQGPCADRFHVTGWVPSTSPFLNAARVSVAPILYGAGMNGKIGEAMCAGLPVVTTSLGALGMDLQHEKNCLIADAPEAFARAILRLHSDEELWHRLSKNGLEHVEKLYAENGLEAIILSALRAQLPDTGARAVRPKTRPDLALPPPKFSNPTTKPKFSVIVLAHNQWKFTELCLRSLSHAELSHPHLAEYILVDNASTDGTPQCAEQIPGLRVIRNQENLGFAAGNNRGMELARGENLILLNNDTIVPPAWLKQLLHHVESIPRLGILGPSTNTESGQNLPGFTYGSIGEFFEKNIALQSFEPGAWERVRKISGLCMVIPRKSYEKLGPLDPDFGLGYFEDDDLCLRAEDLGLTVARAKDLFVHHFGSVSFGAMEKKRLRVLEYGMAQFAFKWGKRGLDHIAREHKETILRPRTAKTVSC